VRIDGWFKKKSATMNQLSAWIDGFQSGRMERRQTTLSKVHKRSRHARSFMGWGNLNHGFPIGNQRAANLTCRRRCYCSIVLRHCSSIRKVKIYASQPQ
jgi:hypothetical protein